MILSIVMMIKNEERYLEKTIRNILPLMKEIDSELIILDTGSTDSSVEIAKKYTSKVYFKEWNGNFSDMRNVSISYARGEWILILDADEQLYNYEKLKRFFSDKLYRDYNSATIELKNIFSEDEKKYSISSILRLFKNEKGFKYKGAIHEQPIFKRPIYNDIASFKHYGYMFIDEEVRQLKSERNKKILLEEIGKSPNHPYTNYQLGKSYRTSLMNEEAKTYMEKAYKLYREKLNYIPIFVSQDLANIYIKLNEFKECEDICNKYIKHDDKNIDIYYYLATSQMNLNKYQESLEHYKRYLLLLDNYNISTQANSMESSADTILSKNQCKINIIKIYYRLSMYEKVVDEIYNIEFEDLKEIYDIVFISLYKSNSIEKIIELYYMCKNSVYEKNIFQGSLESIMMKIKDKDKEKIYAMFSNVEGNYSSLNKLRIGGELALQECNTILKNETDPYYGEILCYAINNDFNIEEVLKGVSYLKIGNYINYIVLTKREYILRIYQYLDKSNNTLDISKINLYSCLSKALMLYGNLTGEKYETLFYMYITYRYYAIKMIYNSSFSDKDILKVLTDKDDEFIININCIITFKESNSLKYIKELKNILVNNPKYKKGIELLIGVFEKEFNTNNELKQLKVKYKDIIKNCMNLGEINKAKKMIDEYEDMFKQDIELLNIKGIIEILENNTDKAEIILKKAFLLSNRNCDTMFNIGYLKESLGYHDEAMKFYNNILVNSKDEELISEVKNKMESLYGKVNS